MVVVEHVPLKADISVTVIVVGVIGALSLSNAANVVEESKEFAVSKLGS